MNWFESKPLKKAPLMSTMSWRTVGMGLPRTVGCMKITQASLPY